MTVDLAVVKICLLAAAYFSVLLVCLFKVVGVAWERVSRSRAHRLPAVVLSVVAMGSAFVTWGHIVSWLQHDRTLYPDLKTWIVDSDRFFKAYDFVSSHDDAWWWSAQLLLWTVSWIPFLVTASSRYGLPVAVPFVAIGFMGAMSVSHCLLLLCCWYSPRAPQRLAPVTMSPLSLLSLLLSLLSVLVSPWLRSHQALFEVNLVLLHLLLLLPVAFDAAWAAAPAGHPGPQSSAGRRASAGALAGKVRASMVLAAAYAALAVGSLTIHVGHSFALGSHASWAHLWDAVWRNHCQVSITVDLVVATAASWLWCALEFGRIGGRAYLGLFLFTVLTPVLSPATTWPLALAVLEMYRVDDVIDAAADDKGKKGR